MLRLACLGSQFVGQLREKSLEGVDVVWVGDDATRFRNELPALKPDAVVIDFAEAGADEAGLRTTLEAVKPQLAIVTYDFARRKYLRDLQASTGARLLQSPVTLDMLRAHLAPFIVLHSLRSGAALLTPKEAALMTDGPRYTRQQLGRLMELQSSVECECPNHVAQLVEKLQSFEAYSRDCENRDEKDARVHAALYGLTKSARSEMEKALALLLEHEKISLT